MRTARIRPGSRSATVEALLVRIDRLARERQDLRSRRAAGRALERNRLALVRSQWELSYALIDRHLRTPARDAA